MFNCFKGLNRKLICSTCLLCMIGTSQLGAIENNPLTLGENTVTIAEVGKNAFLTDSLKDNIYSSHLLPIFSEAPILYVDENGNPSLTIRRVLSEGYHVVPYGKDKSVTVYIAAMPYSENYSVSEIPFNNLDWYVLDQSSWNNLCVKNPGKYVFFYHVKSTDDGIKGTIDGLQNSLTIKTADNMVNMISNNFLSSGESNENGFNEFEELNPKTQALGFRYSYVDENESTPRANTMRISTDPSAFLYLLENLLNGNFTLIGDIRQYNSRNKRIQGDLTIEPTPYAYCMMTRKLAEKINDKNMITTIEQAMTNYGISVEQPYGTSILQSNGEAFPEIDINNVSALSFAAKKVFGIPTKFYTVMNNDTLDQAEIQKLVTENVSSSSLTGTLIVSQNPLNLKNILSDFKSGNLETKKLESDLFTSLNLLKMVATKKDDDKALQLISSLMSQYHITLENPNGLKPSSLT